MEAILRLLRHLDSDVRSAEAVAGRLRQATGGNPFFLMETLRALIEAGQQLEDLAALEELPVPDTVREAVAVRLGRLTPMARQVLEAGAVLGASFAFDVVRQTAGRGEMETVDGLDELVGRQVLVEQADRYQFHHEIIRAAVYSGLGYGRRWLLHRRAGEALEKLCGDRTEEIAAVAPQLARHFEEAGIAEKAVDYLLKAGHNAVRLSAYEEAIAHLTRGLELLGTLPETSERARQELDLQTTLAPALIAAKGFAAPEVERAYTRARELCQQASSREPVLSSSKDSARGVGETRQFFPVLWGQWVFYVTRAEHRVARELAEQLLDLAQNVRDPGLLLQAHHALWTSSLCLGEFASARAHSEHGMALYDPQQHHSQALLYGGHDPGVCCRSFAGPVLWSLGYPDQALQRNHEALSLAQELSHPFSVVLSLYWLAMLHQLRREGPAAREKAEAANTLATEHGLPLYAGWATSVRGWALAQQGQEEEGIAQIRQGLAAYRATGAAMDQTHILALLAEAYARVGWAEEGLSVLAQALVAVHKTGERHYEAELYRLRGELLLMQAEAEVEAKAKAKAEVEACFRQAESCFQHAIEVARRQGARSWELRAVMSLSRLWQQQGKAAKPGPCEEARQMLAEIYGWFSEGFDTADLKEARALLEQLS